MAVVTVEGKIIGSRSTMVIVRAPGTPGEDVRFAEEMIQLVTGRQPSTWHDGTGTITICDSKRYGVQRHGPHHGETFEAHPEESTISVLRTQHDVRFNFFGVSEGAEDAWPDDAEIIPTVRFTDDAGLHWEIDTFLHLQKLENRDW